MVRRRFSEITTRRLGTRGQSKYHYYGLGVRTTSKYYDPETNGSHATYPSVEPIQSDVLCSGVLPSFSVFKSKSPPTETDISTESYRQPVRKTTEVQREVQAFDHQTPKQLQETSSEIHSSRESSEVKLEKAFTVLRTFPSSFDLFVPSGISYDRLDTFLLMYKTHCHRMIDAILCSDFEDVQVYLNHFWSEIPEHLTGLLETEFLSRVIETCDILFYEVRISINSFE